MVQISGATDTEPSEFYKSYTAVETSNVITDGSIRYHVATDLDIRSLKEQLVYQGLDSRYGTNSASNQTYATGILIPTDEELDSLVGQIMIFDGYDSDIVGSSPSSYDLSSEPYFPQVRSQGSEGACAAFATIYYNFGYLVAKDNGWTDASLGNDEHLMSPSWTYNKVSSTGYGSYTWDNAQIAIDLGVSSWSAMPFVDGDHLDWGSERAWRDAPSYKADNTIIYPFDSNSIVQTIKDTLITEHPVTICLDSNEFAPAFADSNYIISSIEYDSSTITHAITIVGYDDSVADDGNIGAFKIVNSWGTSWGEAGYFWMTYDAIEKVGGVLAPISIMEEQSYQPTDVAVWHFNLPPGRDSSISISARRVSDSVSVAIQSPQFYSPGISVMPTFMCMDISSLSEYASNPNYFIQLDIGSSTQAGILSSFRLEKYFENYDTGKALAISMQSSGLPNTTPCSAMNQLPNQSFVTSSEALSYSDGAFSFSGTTQWVGVRDVQGRQHAMQSGDIGDSSSSGFVAMVDGPGTISFDWKVSSEENFDYLNLYLDSILTAQISGETSWATQTMNITSGFHYMIWSYEKDGSHSVANDCGWIDNVAWGGRSSILFDSFEPNELNHWYVGDENSASGVDYWSSSTLNYWTGTHALWCAENGTGANGLPNHLNQYYDENMDAYSYVALPNLDGINDAKLSFVYWAKTGSVSLADYSYVRVFNGSSWSTVWTQPSVDSSGWALAELTLPEGSQKLAFCFHSDGTVGLGPYAGVYIDDVLLTISDSQAPSSSISSLSTFTKTQGVDLTCQATDAGGSGLAFVQLFYRKGISGGYTMYTTDANPSGQWASGTNYIDLEYLGLGEGLYQFYSIAVDRAGNVEPTTTTPDASTTFDLAAPTTTASNDGVDAPGWNVGTITVTLAANDPISGVSFTSYRIDEGSWNPYSVPFLVSTQGSHIVQYYSTDNAGNTEITRSMMFNIDIQAPVSTGVVSGENGNGVWFVGSVNVNITSTDQGSGVQKVIYCLDGGTWVEYVGNISIDAQGNHTLEYMANDLAGNVETIKTLSFKIDNTPPITTATLTGNKVPDRGLYNSSVSIVLSSQDDISGVGTIQYSLDEAAWATYHDNIIVTSEGNHSLMFRSIDLAGNIEQQSIVNFTVDKTAPTSGATLTGGEGTNGWYISAITITISANDNTSGVKEIRYRLDGGEWIIATSAITIAIDGIHTLEYYSVDNAGNIGAVNSTVLKIDQSLTTVLYSLDDGQTVTSSSLTITLDINDTGSGIMSMEYRIDGGSYISFSGEEIELSGLKDGHHILSLKIVDQAGNIVLKELPFKVDTNPISPTGPNGILPLVAIVIAVVGIALAVFLLRRRPTK